MAALKRMAAFGPHPAQELNFTVVDKLCSWGYAELSWGASPYKTHQRKTMKPVSIRFIGATQAGLDALAEQKAAARAV